MAKFKDIISINNLSIEEIDISGIENIIQLLPTDGNVDSNIAERGLVYTLEGQNLCQEKIAQLDVWIGYIETKRNKAWSSAALEKSKQHGYKTAKDKEWYAQSENNYVEAYNELALAKACKKWFENKASYFSGWHYAFKTFLRRDYSIENATGLKVSAYNPMQNGSASFPGKSDDDDIGGDMNWG